MGKTWQPKTIRELAEDFATSEDDGDFRKGLEAIRELRHAMRVNEPILVEMARDEGASWEEIAELTGLGSRQEAHRKWHVGGAGIA